MIGTIGQLLLLVALVASGVAGAAFFLSTRSEDQAARWVPIARGAWGAMALAVVAAAGLLFYLLLTHQYQYAYVYQHVSNDQPLKYIISAFWGGQEGSFLLWILMTTGVGSVFLMLAPRRWRRPVMAVVALSLLMLLSMVAGLQIGPVTIGASPFDTLAASMPEAPIFQQNPDFIPADGTGLNDLLQNPWMVIHPVVLFLGFSAMLIPFAFAIVALWKKRYVQWVPPALPWMLFAVMILGTGIAMGGYWAYVTLNFGGYWAWDPVENASLVPWIVGVAGLHTMLVQKKSGRAHKAALLLSLLGYILVIYSTFLTRTNILSNASVHAFVDLGLFEHLFGWLAVTTGAGLGLFAWRYRDLPTPEREARLLSRESMIFIGATLLCTTAAVVTLGTSAPIFGRLFRESPSGVPVDFYNRWTLPLAVAFVFLAGLGQLLWWNKMSVKNLNRVLLKPIGGAVAATIAVLLFTPFVEKTVTLPPPGGLPGGSPGGLPTAQAGLVSGLATFWTTYGQGLLLVLLVFAGFFALFGNGLVLWRVGRGNTRMAGGALAHVGFALTILGIISSSAFSDAIAPRGLTESNEPRKNFILARGQTRTVEGYRVTYADKTTNERGRGVYVLDVQAPNGRSFTLRPVAYQGAGEQWFMQPDVKMFAEKDIYASITPRAATGMSEDANGGEITLQKGQRRTLGTDRFDVRLGGFSTQVDPGRLPDSAEVAVAANLEITNRETGETRRLRPIYVVLEDRTERFGQTRLSDWGLTLTFTGLNVDSGAARFAIEGARVMPEDWLVVQAREKPFIGVLWAGILILSAGFGLAFYRRTKDLAFRLNRRLR